MTRLFLKIGIYIFVLHIFTSCAVYKKHFMFQTQQETIIDSLQKSAESTSNYIIRKNDFIKVDVFTNFGEKLVDPNNELQRAQGGAVNTAVSIEKKYLVGDDGNAILPMIGKLKLEGLTLRQADSILAIEYSKFYYNCYVKTKIENRRVIVLNHTTGKIIPLENENTTLIEVLASSGAMTPDGNSSNIKLVRGDLKNPEVFIINLSTVEGMKKSITNLQPNDIIYVEQNRRMFPAFLQDLNPIISLFFSFISVVTLILTLTNRQ